MADYDVPTADDVFTRFPDLDGTKEDTVTALIAEAVSQVSVKWRAVDYPVAIMYWVAHMLTTETGEMVDRAGSITSESFGQQSRSYGGNNASGRSASNLDSTEYGRRFVELRRKNFPGMLVAGY